jgi:hypothetical protein
LDFVWTAAVGGSHFILDLDFQILLVMVDPVTDLALQRFITIADLVGAAKRTSIQEE